MLKGYKAEAQQVLDELFSEKLLPFKLSAREIKSVGAAEYLVYFHDSRLHSVDVSCREDRPFRDEFRAAILGRAGRVSGRLPKKPDDE